MIMILPYLLLRLKFLNKYTIFLVNLYGPNTAMSFFGTFSDVFAYAYRDFIFNTGDVDTSLVYHNYIHIKTKNTTM